jgi:hypothetical protein
MFKRGMTQTLTDHVFRITLNQSQKPSCLSENQPQNGHAYQFLGGKILQGILRYALPANGVMLEWSDMLK